jgi:hypothetical protein
MVANIRTRWTGADLEFYDVQTGTTILKLDDALAVDVAQTLKLGGVAVSADATELSEYSVTVHMADANTAGSVFVVLPHAGTIRGLCVVNQGANADVKTTFTAEIGGVAVTHAAWELALDAAAGTKSSVVPSAANAVAADSVLELISDGAGSSVMPVIFTVKILR